mgnify:CR=1 FL=1
MYRGLWVYPKVGKKPVCGAKIFTAYGHAERGGGENLRPLFASPKCSENVFCASTFRGRGGADHAAPQKLEEPRR